MVEVAIVNYGVGNLKSVKRAIERAGARPIITLSADDVAKAGAIILPGVGSFKSAMEGLQPLMSTLREAISRGKPVLGICLGLQLFFEWSEEGGGVGGLGLMKGVVDRLPSSVKVPHMGWNTISIESQNPLVEGVPDGSYVYFVHSYKANPEDPGNIVATTVYGVKFPSIVWRKPLIFGTQFHPEKSGGVGFTMIKNFVSMARR
ncbi:MAG: imidazole glycerol phosphate synthase subunit HisH [Thermoprotei archaeon]|nr:MAG: imidazole glycerol phosphate synthase subunit HisH [Thermoprotei archaeon]